MQFKLWLEAEIIRRSGTHIPLRHDFITISLPYNIFINSVKKPITIEKEIKVEEEDQLYFYMPGRLVTLELTDNDEIVDTMQFRLQSEFYSNGEKLHWSDATSRFENNEPISIKIKIDLDPVRIEKSGEDIEKCQQYYHAGYGGEEFKLPEGISMLSPAVENLKNCFNIGRYDIINLFAFGTSMNIIDKSIHFNILIIEVLYENNQIFKNFMDKLSLLSTGIKPGQAGGRSFYDSIRFIDSLADFALADFALADFVLTNLLFEVMSSPGSNKENEIKKIFNIIIEIIENYHIAEENEGGFINCFSILVNMIVDILKNNTLSLNFNFDNVDKDDKDEVNSYIQNTFGLNIIINTLDQLLSIFNKLKEHDAKGNIISGFINIRGKEVFYEID